MGRVGGALIEDEKPPDQRSRDQDHPRGCPPSSRGPECDHDRAGGKEPKSRRMGRDRDAEEHGRQNVAARVPALQRENRGEARGDRKQRGNPHSREQLLPAGAEKEKENRRCESEEAADPAACDRKEEGRADQGQDDRGEAIGKVGADAEDLEHRLVGHHRQGDQVQVRVEDHVPEVVLAQALGVEEIVPRHHLAPPPVDQHADGDDHRHGENRQRDCPTSVLAPFRRHGGGGYSLPLRARSALPTLRASLT